MLSPRENMMLQFLNEFYVYLFHPFASYEEFLENMISISHYNNLWTIHRECFFKNAFIIKVIHLIVLTLVTPNLHTWSMIANYEYSFYRQNNNLRDLMLAAIFIQPVFDLSGVVLKNSYKLIFLNRELIWDSRLEKDSSYFFARDLKIFSFLII